MKIKIYVIVTIGFILPTIYINYISYRSYIFQDALIGDFLSNKYKSISIQKLNTVNLDYPNLSVYAIPLKQIVSNYYFLSNQFEKALDLINQGEKENPYFMYGSSLKADIYDNLKVNDSMLYFSRKAFFTMPNNTRHYLQYLRALTKNKKYDSVRESYNAIAKYKNPELSKVLLSTLVAIKDSSDESKKIALDLSKTFPDNETIRVASNIVRFGQNAIDNSIKLAEEGVVHFEREDFSVSAEKFSKASIFNPDEYSNFENAGISYYNNEDFIKAKIFLLNSLKKWNSPKNGKASYFLGVTYINLNKKDSACIYLKRAISENFRPAFSEMAKNCK